MKNLLKKVKSPFFKLFVKKLPDVSCKIIYDINFKLCIVLFEIIKLLINAIVLGFSKKGTNKL